MPEGLLQDADVVSYSETGAAAGSAQYAVGANGRTGNTARLTMRDDRSILQQPPERA